MRLAFVNGTNLNGRVALIDANGQTLTFAERYNIKIQVSVSFLETLQVISWEVMWR